MYQKQYDRWEVDNDSIFIDFMRMRKSQMENIILLQWVNVYNRDPFDPPRTNFEPFQEGIKIFF
jgi:hypothetical protein